MLIVHLRWTMVKFFRWGLIQDKVCAAQAPNCCRLDRRLVQKRKFQALVYKVDGWCSTIESIMNKALSIAFVAISLSLPGHGLAQEQDFLFPKYFVQLQFFERKVESR
jgi:hypothetical protein